MDLQGNESIPRSDETWAADLEEAEENEGATAVEGHILWASDDRRWSRGWKRSYVGGRMQVVCWPGGIYDCLVREKGKRKKEKGKKKRDETQTAFSIG